MAPINAGNRQAVLLIILSLLASITLAAHLAIRATRPILRLNQSAAWARRILGLERRADLGEAYDRLNLLFSTQLTKARRVSLLAASVLQWRRFSFCAW
jgi:hypothetical protein